MGNRFFNEKRQHRRFKVRKNVFVEFSSRLPHIGQLVDISQGGLSFRYFLMGEQKAFDELRIYMSGNGFSLENLKVKTISDIRIPSLLGHSVIEIRRKGVQFENLSSQDVDLLEYFIRKHAAGEA